MLVEADWCRGLPPAELATQARFHRFGAPGAPRIPTGRSSTFRHIVRCLNVTSGPQPWLAARPT